jgi:hypothetical protein
VYSFCRFCIFMVFDFWIFIVLFSFVGFCFNCCDLSFFGCVCG